jgi:hypothetical protein
MNRSGSTSVYISIVGNPGLRAIRPKLLQVTGVAVADLRIVDAALSEAQATWRTAGNRLAPVVRALQGLDTQVVGADPLIGKLQEAQELLGADVVGPTR